MKEGTRSIGGVLPAVEVLCAMISCVLAGGAVCAPIHRAGDFGVRVKTPATLRGSFSGPFCAVARGDFSELPACSFSVFSFGDDKISLRGMNLHWNGKLTWTFKIS